MRKTVLVVDDEMLIALDIQADLEERGHKVILAPSVKGAIAAIADQRIDVAVVDWHLQHEVSAPLIEVLKDHKIPFVLCSGSALEELATLFPSSPIILKPFRADDLMTALTRAVDGVAVN